jgi:hypothetical protein
MDAETLSTPGSTLGAIAGLFVLAAVAVAFLGGGLVLKGLLEPSDRQLARISALCESRAHDLTGDRRAESIERCVSFERRARTQY